MVLDTTNANNGIPDISINNAEILQNITLLQNYEQELMSDLENNQGLTSQQQQQIIQKIQQLTDIRAGLYSTLSGMNSFYEKALSSSTGTLTEQTAAIDIVETELNRSKKRLEYLQMEKNNKIRLVEINEYYGDKYEEHTSLMKIVIFTLIPIIILTFVYNRGILPSRIYYLLFIIIGIVGATYFWNTYSSIITRDNMVYDEYKWNFDLNSAPKGTGDDKDPWLSSGTFGTCIGEACCEPDQYYNSDIDKCITGVKEQFTMKSLEDDLFAGLAKVQPGKYKADVNLKDSYNAYND